MIVKEYLEKIGKYDSVTFIKARARKDANTPFFHAEYQETPINPACKWEGDILQAIILNDNQPPIEWLSGAAWSNVFEAGNLKSLLVVSPEDLILLIPNEEQRKGIIEYIEGKLSI